MVWLLQWCGVACVHAVIRHAAGCGAKRHCTDPAVVHLP
jgi:hypothetical protein